jgi:hypothetical protein
MSTITTRSGKGSPLTNNEVDANFTNLNTDKLESADLAGYAELTGATFTGEVEATGFNGDLTGAILFKGQAGEALTKGDPVYISGISGNKTVVSKADANDASKMPCFGIVDATVSANADCSVVTFGTLQGLDTSSFSEGDELFVSDTGTLTTTAPTGESSQIQKIGKVTRSHASTGSIKVMGAGRTNAVPNLNDGQFFLGNGSNQAVSTDFTTSVLGEISAGTGIGISGSGVISNSAPDQTVALTGAGTTTVSGTYPNFTITGAGTTYTAGTGITLTGTEFSIGQPVATTDSPTFAGLTVDTDTLYVDSTNNRVGIGTSSPNADLHINKSSGAKLWITAEGSNPSDAGSLRFSELSDGNNYFEFQHNGNANKLNLTTSNGDLVTFDRINKRVGIGTTSPAESIHTAGNIRLGDSAPAELYSNSSELRFGVDKNNDNGTSNITFYVDNSEKVRIDSSGKVGIGTTSPSAEVDIVSGSAVGLKVNHDNFYQGIVSYRNHATNSASFVFENTSGRQGTLYTQNNFPMWRDGTTINSHKIWTAGNDGAGSLLDADTVDSLQASQFLRSDTSDSLAGNLTFSNYAYKAQWGTGGSYVTGGPYVSYNLSVAAASGSVYFYSIGQSGEIAKIGRTESMFKTAVKIDSGYGHTDIIAPNMGSPMYIKANDANCFYLYTNGNVTIPDGDLTVDNGTTTKVNVVSNDNGQSEINLYGVSQGTGRVYVGQSLSYGGGIEYNGDNSPATSGASADRITLYRRTNGTNYWTAQNAHSSNNWSFRGTITQNASDERLKENITPIENALDKVSQLKGVTFDWKDDVEEKGFIPFAKHETGVIAQDVQKVIPDAAVPAPFDENYLTVQHEKIIPLLIESVKELKQTVDTLQARIDELETK